MDYKNLFEKMKFLDFMASDLIAFASRKYGAEFEEYIDMTYGAIPDGEYEKIIDVSCPKPFVDLYTLIAIKRFRSSYEKILELGEGYQKILDDYLSNEAQNLGLEKPENVLDAYNLINFCIPDFPGKEENEIILNEDKKICWQKKDFEGTDFLLLFKPFIDSILKGTKISFSTDKNIFCLKEISPGKADSKEI